MPLGLMRIILQFTTGQTALHQPPAINAAKTSVFIAYPLLHTHCCVPNRFHPNPTRFPNLPTLDASYNLLRP